MKPSNFAWLHAPQRPDKRSAGRGRTRHATRAIVHGAPLRPDNVLVHANSPLATVTFGACDPPHDAFPYFSYGPPPLRQG